MRYQYRNARLLGGLVQFLACLVSVGCFDALFFAAAQTVKEGATSMVSNIFLDLCIIRKTVNR